MWAEEERKGGMESPGTGPAEEFKGACVHCSLMLRARALGPASLD